MKLLVAHGAGPGPLSVGPLSAMIRTIEQHVDFIADCLEALRAKGVSVIATGTDAIRAEIAAQAGEPPIAR